MKRHLGGNVPLHFHEEMRCTIRDFNVPKRCSTVWRRTRIALASFCRFCALSHSTDVARPAEVESIESSVDSTSAGGRRNYFESRPI